MTRTMQNTLRKALKPLAAVVAAMAVSALLIMAAGQDPLFIFAKMLRMTFGSDYGTGQIMFRTTSLLLTGLAVAIPFRMKLFNIGGEGQLLAGACAAAVAGMAVPSWLPSPAGIAVAAAAAMAAGGSLGLAAGWLKVRYGVNEVISTIMLNFIAQAAVSYLLTAHLAVPSTVHTPDISQAAVIPAIDDVLGIWKRSPANLSIVLALLACVTTWAVIFRTRAGYEMRAAGINHEAAAYAGIRTTWYQLGAMAAGGAAAGLAAANLVLGYKHSFEAGLTSGLGFSGIAVALLGWAHPLWIAVSALLFGFLEYGGLAVNAYVPKDIFMMVQAVTIILIVVSGIRK